MISDLPGSWVLSPLQKYMNIKIFPIFPFWGDVRSLQSNAPLPSKPSPGCSLLSQNLHETPAGWVPLVMGHAADGNTALSELPAGENLHLGESTAENQDQGEDTQTKDVSSNIFCSQRLLSPCLHFSALSSLSDTRKRKVPWCSLDSHFYCMTNLKRSGQMFQSKIFCIVCIVCKKAIFLYL